MKLTILFGIAALYSTSCFAAALGDKATYNVTMAGVSAQDTMEIIAINGANASVKDSVIFQGQVVQTQTADRAISDLDGFKMVVSNCALAGGTAESTTVTAGTFSTCHVSKTDASGTADYYLSAQVPFGIVKASQPSQNGVVTIELASFNLGQAAN